MSQPDSRSISTDTPLGFGPGDSAPRARDLTGSSLGDFQVDRLLGRGGMGEVYLARQLSLNRQVALKVLRPDLAANPTYVARFEAEAWAAAKLSHPNIVHIYSLGTFESLRFIAMEYVQGTNLREYLQRKGSVDLNQGLSIMRQAGAAVGAAGEVGLVHRDIKPENLLLTKKGQVKVADFGLCRDLDREHHVTQSGVTMGTPLYMSPEQARGIAMDHRSDLYSLGVTYYHMLAGQPPFRADSALALAMKHVSDTPVDLSVHRPDLPPALCRLVMTLMAKSPADRYQSAAEMLRDLTKIRETIQVSALVAASGVTVPSPAVADPIAAIDTASRARADSKPKAGTVDIPGADAGPLFSWPDARSTALASALGLALGIGLGWLARPADLLRADPLAKPPPPALWIAPNWESVARKASPAEQYRFAQVQADAIDRQAAWVAVSGHFPGDAEWASKSYAQLARELFRSRDRDRLNAFADVLATSHYGRNEALTPLMVAAVAALDGDAEKVLTYFVTSDFNAIKIMHDPAFVDFGLEVTSQLRKDARRLNLNGSVTNDLQDVQARLLRRLLDIKRRDLPG